MHNFRDITTFKKACEALGLNYGAMYIRVKDTAVYSKASAAMYQLNIIRKVLNLGRDLHLTKKTKNSCIYYPFNPFITKSSTSYKGALNSGEMEVIGEIKSKGEEYYVLGCHADKDGDAGLGGFYSGAGVGLANASVGFLGCATKEIAEHFGKYFGMLITEAKFADMVNFKIIEDKYGNTK